MPITNTTDQGSNLTSSLFMVIGFSYCIVGSTLHGVLFWYADAVTQWGKLRMFEVCRLSHWRFSHQPTRTSLEPSFSAEKEVKGVPIQRVTVHHTESVRARGSHWAPWKAATGSWETTATLNQTALCYRLLRKNHAPLFIVFSHVFVAGFTLGAVGNYLSPFELAN